MVDESQSRPQEQGPSDGADAEPPAPRFILYLDGVEYQSELFRLAQWTHHVLLPVYGREVTSSAPWCSRWWEHQEAVAQLHGLWLAWAELTGPYAETTGPASWHRDFLGPVLGALRDPSGPFAGCKPGSHRSKVVPPVEPLVPPPAA
ncbi:DUF4913 domain-containing protein [Streptomyces sp. PU-14G]|uniref:DUF4913 domain-containing protein n=1 Tax=Streptomyces sp. PU-14G TaxID=2800808 RepID=UPI0034DEF3D5